MESQLDSLILRNSFSLRQSTRLSEMSGSVESQLSQSNVALTTLKHRTQTLEIVSLSGSQPLYSGSVESQLSQSNVAFTNLKQMGLVVRKPVYRVSNKASFKPISSATETS